MIVNLEGNANILQCNFNPPIKAEKIGLVKFFAIVGDKLPRPNGHKTVTRITIISNITKGAYENSNQAHFIEKFPVILKGSEIDTEEISYYIECEPKNIIYFPTMEKLITNISINFLDQDGAEIKSKIFKSVLLHLE